MVVAALPHEAAGLKRQIVRGEWSTAAGTAAGSPNQGAFHRNPQYRLTLSRPAEVRRVTSRKPQATSHKPQATRHTSQATPPLARGRGLGQGRGLGPGAIGIREEGWGQSQSQGSRVRGKGPGLGLVSSATRHRPAAPPNTTHHHNRPPPTPQVLLRLRCATRPKERPSLLLALFAQTQRLDANTARLSLARATSSGGVYCCPAGGALVPRATLEAGVYVAVPSTFDKWAGPFELMVCAPEGAVRVELLPG